MNKNNVSCTVEFCCQSVYAPLRLFGLVIAELCADELVVGGGVGWSYDRWRPQTK